MIRWTMLLGWLCTALAGASHADLAAGDLAWNARAIEREEDLATPDAIERAIAQYREAIVAEPTSLEAHWKLLRALHYSIDFTTHPESIQRERVDEAVALTRNAIAQLETGVGSSSERAHLYFWCAIAWGARAQRVGLLTIVREGVATRMHDFAERSLGLDETVDRGGALRLLSRLHSSLPRVPFISGWVDRDRALPLAERAHALDPGHPGNALVLALTLLEREPAREEQAEALLRRVTASTPRSDYLIEDLRIIAEAKETLEQRSGEAS